jgi:hypothetical protein
MAGLDSTTQAAAPDPTSAIYLSCFPLSRACTSSASGCCLLNCMIRGQQRPSGQLPRSPLDTTSLNICSSLEIGTLPRLSPLSRVM